MHLGANEAVDAHSGLPARFHHTAPRRYWHGPYLGEDQRDRYHNMLGDIQLVDVTPALQVSDIPPMPDFVTPLAPDIQPPTIDIVGSGPFTSGPAPTSNWFSQDVLPVLGLAEQAFAVSVTHQQPGITGVGYGPGLTGSVPGGLTQAQWATMTPTQQSAWLQAHTTSVPQTTIPSLTSMLGGSSGMLLLGGISLVAMIMLMRPAAAPARR